MPRRPIVRRLFASIAILSLVLCVATIGMWVRSYWREETIRYRNDGPTQFIQAAVSFGEVEFDWSEIPLSFRSGFQPAGWECTSRRSFTNDLYDLRTWGNRFDPPSRGFWFLGFGYYSSGLRYFTYKLVLPLWFPALLFAIPPAIWFRSHMRLRGRIRKGHCSQCGYDLRATPDRCPECGFTPPSLPAQIR